MQILYIYWINWIDGISIDFCFVDTERAVELLREYYSTLPDPEEGQLRAAIGKVSNIFSSDLFQALLGNTSCYMFKCYFQIRI